MANNSIRKVRTLKLRDKLFLSYGALSVVILLAAAAVIDRQVVSQARQQVQEEMKTALPLYEAVWQEQAGRLTALGMALAGSPVAKTIFGDPRASRDAETIRQMLADFAQPLAKNVDLVAVTDGGGNVVFEEIRGAATGDVREIPAARVVGRTQKEAESYELIDGRLYHLALAPVLSHSNNAEFNNTLGVLVAGSELDHRMAADLRLRAHSDVVFFADQHIFSSSLDPASEQAAGGIVAADVVSRAGGEPTDLTVGGESHLAFARPLTSIGGSVVGHVVVLHSLGTASRLFRAISSRLLLIGTIAVVSVLLVSYAIALRITRPIEALAVGAREFGKGNYEHPVAVTADDEIGQLAAAFDQMRLSIRQGQASLLRNERLATIGQMASGIIHDLRSPLAAITTAAEVLTRSELPTEKRQLLADNQLRASRRMEAMLTELLEYSQGKYSLRLRHQELAPLLRAAADDVLASSSVLGIGVELNIPPGVAVQVDVERVRRLFDNLLSNSVHAMPGGGTISVSANTVGERVRIHLADTGSGIPEELRERLFEPFASQGKKGGTGLGLAIARSIAEAHRGTLTLVSDVGRPAEFCIELPISLEVQHGGKNPAG